MRFQFLTELTTTWATDKSAVLTHPLVYESAFLQRVIHVPEGFSTDFASVPRLPVLYAAMGNIAHAPAVVHDYLYSSREVSRREADEVFYEAMRVIGVPKWKALPMFWAVRAFGWRFYGKD